MEALGGVGFLLARDFQALGVRTVGDLLSLKDDGQWRGAPFLLPRDLVTIRRWAAAKVAAWEREKAGAEPVHGGIYLDLRTAGVDLDLPWPDALTALSTRARMALRSCATLGDVAELFFETPPEILFRIKNLGETTVGEVRSAVRGIASAGLKAFWFDGQAVPGDIYGFVRCALALLSERERFAVEATLAGARQIDLAARLRCSRGRAHQLLRRAQVRLATRFRPFLASFLGPILAGPGVQSGLLGRAKLGPLARSASLDEAALVLSLATGRTWRGEETEAGDILTAHRRDRLQAFRRAAIRALRSPRAAAGVSIDEIIALGERHLGCRLEAPVLCDAIPGLELSGDGKARLAT